MADETLDGMLGELAKAIDRAWDATDLDDDDALLEALEEGHRLIAAIGLLRGREVRRG